MQYDLEYVQFEKQLKAYKLWICTLCFGFEEIQISKYISQFDS